MACDNICAVVLNDLIYDCSNKSTGGLVQTVKLINKCDIDLSEWTVDRTQTPTACTHLITEYTGADPAALNAVKVQGMPGKRLISATFSSSDSEYGTYYTHLVNLFIQGLTREALCNIKALGEGAELVAIVEQNAKGASNQDAFLVFGWDAGLKLGDLTYDSNANNGNTLVPITSREPDLEPFPPMVMDFGGYATTKTFFDSL